MIGPVTQRDGAGDPAGDSGGRLTVLTPSYGPDLALFRRLHASVQAFAPPGTEHLAVVPPGDVKSFRAIASTSLRVVAVETYIPSSFRRLPGVNAHINLRSPRLPVRGWITQQVIKLAATAALDADLVLVVDSDVELVRPLHGRLTDEGGRALFYCHPEGVHAGLPRHLEWHRVARRLLGLSPAVSAPLSDYIAPFAVWRPATVRELLRLVEATSGARWQDAVGAQRHFSEFTIYGVFVEHVLGTRDVQVSPSSLCHCYWPEEPLSTPEAIEFARRTPSRDVAVMISSKSGTSMESRRAAAASVPTVSG